MRLKYKPGETVIMRNADYVRRQAQEVQIDNVVMPALEPASSNYGDIDMEDLDELLDELPDLSAVDSGPGRASQMEIPILRSEPIHSTITISSTSAWPLTSDNANGNDNGDNDDNGRDDGRDDGRDEEMGGT
jgi:hypothetical protein